MREQFEPGDRVEIIDPTKCFFPVRDNERTWTVVSYPWRQWDGESVMICDSEGRKRAVDVSNLKLADDNAGGCNNGYCEL